MSYATRRPVDESRSGANGTPTTATVLDYVCLFTHDLRRKQKRWQDGRLKYHTFNKRIMVYDDRGSLVGDAHWHAGGDLGTGDELELDRGSAIVQVAECAGSREQDLTEIVDRRAREVEKRRASARRQDGQPHFQLHHRPLSTIVPSPGPLGRAAIPDRSPYEARRSGGAAGPDTPATKRRKTSVSPPSKAGHAQSLFGARLTLSAGPVGLASARSVTPRERVNMQAERKGESRGNGVKTSKEGRGGGRPGDDEAMVLEGPPSARETATKVTRSRATPAHLDSTVAEAEAQDVGMADCQAAQQDSRRGKQLDRMPRPDLRIAEANDASERARPTTNETRRTIHRPRTSNDDTEAAESRPSRQRTQVTVSSKRSAPADRHGDTPSRPSVEEHTAQPRRAEPRTELRIRPRQRRGLLVVSEKNHKQEEVLERRLESIVSSSHRVETSRSTRLRKPDRPSEEAEAIDATPEPSPAHHAVPSSAAESGSESDEVAANLRRSHGVAPVFAESSSESDAAPVDCRRKDNTRAPESDGDEPDCLVHRVGRGRSSARVTSDDEPGDPPSPPMKRRTKRTCRRDSGSVQTDEKLAPAGLRITKMARKSVKSKEIIGFVTPCGEDIVPAPFAMATYRMGLGANQARQTPSAAARDTMKEHADKTTTKPLPPGQGPAVERTTKTVNPATRGKKAARKEDGAGRAPQSLVPMESAAPARDTAQVTAENGSNLPGFTRANGGAWSRHAQDLLGMARPTRR